MHSYYKLISRNAGIEPKKKMMDYAVVHYEMKWKAYWAIEAGAERDSVSIMINATHHVVDKALRAAITDEYVTHEEYVAKLNSTPLKAKREVTAAMAIIPTAAAAAYLGVPEVRLREMKDKALFGAKYLGRQCFSLDELALLAMNPGWLSRYTPENSAEQITLPDPAALDKMIFVDEDFACAYTDLDSYNLAKQVKPSQRRYGTYNLKHQFRLSDLEKIRVAKQNGVQH